MNYETFLLIAAHYYVASYPRVVERTIRRRNGESITVRQTRGYEYEIRPRTHASVPQPLPTHARRYGVYCCKVCLGFNAATRTHCQYCGVTPAHYSPITEKFEGVTMGVPSIEKSESLAVNRVIRACVANGADRPEHHKTRRVYFRTVPADYYAAE